MRGLKRPLRGCNFPMLRNAELLAEFGEELRVRRRIGELREEGLSDEAIAKKIGIKRTTFLSRLKKAKEKLCEEFPDEMHEQFPDWF